MVWNLWFVEEAVTHGHSPYWTREVYFPVGTHLAKHTLAAGFLPLTLAVRALSGASPLFPVYAYKAAIALSVALALALSYLLFRRLGFSRGASAVPAMGFAFCRYSQLHIPHIHHLAGAALLPGAGLAVAALLSRPGRKTALVLALLLAWGVYLTEFVAFVAMALAVVALGALASRTGRAALESLRGVGRANALLALLVLGLAVTPFAAAWVEDRAQPPKERQAEVTSANLAGLLIPDSDFTHLYGSRFASWSALVRRGVSGRETFLSYPLFLLGILGLLAPTGRFRLTGALLFFVFLVLCLGPELKILEDNTEVPLPYALLRRIPPFQMARSPVRFVLVAIFGEALLAASGIQFLEGIAARRGSAALAALVAVPLGLWVVLETYHPVPRLAPYEPPTSRLAALRPGGVLNVPISAWDGYALFLQTVHHHPIATGFVSRGEAEPTDHVKAIDHLLETDPPAFAERLLAEGIPNVVVAGEALPRVREQLQGLPLNVVWMRDP
jgi:hypothetical protein